MEGEPPGEPPCAPFPHRRGLVVLPPSQWGLKGVEDERPREPSGSEFGVR